MGQCSNTGPQECGSGAGRVFCGIPLHRPTRLPEWAAVAPLEGKSIDEFPPVSCIVGSFQIKAREKTHAVLPQSSQPEPDVRNLKLFLKFSHNPYYGKGRPHSLLRALEAASPMRNTQQLLPRSTHSAMGLHLLPLIACRGEHVSLLTGGVFQAPRRAGTFPGLQAGGWWNWNPAALGSCVRSAASAVVACRSTCLSPSSS